MKKKDSKKDYITYLIITFFSVAFLGWIYEVVFFSIREHAFINRGFLYGPILPIYGYATILVVVLFKNEKNVFLKFLKPLITVTCLEYVSSFFIELIFKNRWWDYSHEMFNLNGRICLHNSLIFGLVGFLVLTYFYPFLEKKLVKIPYNTRKIICIILLTGMVIDTIISYVCLHTGYSISYNN